VKHARTLKPIILIVAVALLCLLLALPGCGCGNKADEQESDEPAVQTEGMEKTVDAETGQHFDISLESNPSTGYSWQVVQSPNKKVVRVLDSHFVEPSGDALGAPGTEVWQFQAVGKGTTKMVMEYSQPWEKSAPPAKRYTLTINVAQADNEISHSFNIEVGQTFNVTLDTNPSTGYSWSLAQQPDANVLKLVSSDTAASSTPGATAQQIWKFQGVGPGNTTFVLEYRGPGAGAPVEKKDTVKVAVTQAPAPPPVPPKTYTDPNAPITASVGEVFILEVKSQAGTDYTWQLMEETDGKILKSLGSAFTYTGSELGGDGVTKFTFEAVGKGEQTVKLGLMESGGDAPTQDADFKVTVK
jgi:inhibitor of cysteine peptidase